MAPLRPAALLILAATACGQDTAGDKAALTAFAVRSMFCSRGLSAFGFTSAACCCSRCP
jgi:hypothetical protein